MLSFRFLNKIKFPVGSLDFINRNACFICNDTVRTSLHGNQEILVRNRDAHFYFRFIPGACRFLNLFMNAFSRFHCIIGSGPF